MPQFIGEIVDVGSSEADFLIIWDLSSLALSAEVIHCTSIAQLLCYIIPGISKQLKIHLRK
jgi:hypothetical protein